MVKITLNLHSSGRMNRSVEVIQKVQNSCFITSFSKEFCLHINPPHATSDGHTIFICMYYSCVFKNSILGIWTLLLQTSPLLQFRLNLWKLVILLYVHFSIIRKLTYGQKGDKCQLSTTISYLKSTYLQILLIEV